MRKETYNDLIKLNELSKYNINYSIDSVLDGMCINFIQEILDNEQYTIDLEDQQKLLKLIENIQNNGNR